MGIFEDVVINTKSAINVFGKKAGELVDVSKMKISAVEIDNEISKKFEEIGKLVYDSNKNDNVHDSEIGDLMNHVDQLYQKLNDVNEQIAAMKKKCKCKQCGFLNTEESLYCCKCGIKISNANTTNSEGEDNQEGMPEIKFEQQDESNSTL